MLGSIIIRADRNVPWKTVCCHAVENDKKLSWKACGLLLYLASRPLHWEFHRLDLERRHSDGEASVRSAKNELIEGGYLRILGPRSIKGTFTRGIWVVAEIPRSEKEWKELLEKEGLESPANLKSI